MLEVACGLYVLGDVAVIALVGIGIWRLRKWGRRKLDRMGRAWIEDMRKGGW